MDLDNAPAKTAISLKRFWALALPLAVDACDCTLEPAGTVIVLVVHIQILFHPAFLLVWAVCHLAGFSSFFFKLQLNVDIGRCTVIKSSNLLSVFIYYIGSGMGVGKTISIIALILANPTQVPSSAAQAPAAAHDTTPEGLTMFSSAATLIVCSLSLVGH